MTVPAQWTMRTCQRCGMEFPRPSGDAHRICKECHDYIPDLHSDPNRQRTYDMAVELVTLRLAVEMATACLRTGRHRRALAALEAAAAPMRANNR